MPEIRAADGIVCARDALARTVRLTVLLSGRGVLAWQIRRHKKAVTQVCVTAWQCQSWHFPLQFV